MFSNDPHCLSADAIYAELSRLETRGEIDDFELGVDGQWLIMFDNSLIELSAREISRRILAGKGVAC